MKILGKLGAIFGLFLLGCLVTACYWLYFYSADLPSVVELSQYNPAAPSEVHARAIDGSPLLTHVIPTDRLGNFFMRAVIAAEGQPESRGPIRLTIAGIISGARPTGGMYSLHARELVIPERTIRRLDEIRLAEHIQRRFNQQQILTIYMNRVYLGDNTYGVEDASVRYFGKHAADLSLDETALVAGLIRSPGRDSPVQHPERAVERRNWVVDEMLRERAVSADDAEQAKTAPLIVKQTTSSQASYDWNRCALKIVSHTSPATTTIHVRSGEKPSKQIPVITFEVPESGEIRNAVVAQRSGIADIDNYALESIRGMKYRERPPGCGTIENRAAVNVDLSSF
jgi:hypothetical protein